MPQPDASAAGIPGSVGSSSPSFYSATSGIYSSTHPPVLLPSDPSLSLVSHLFARLPLDDPRASSLVEAATAATVSRADLRRLVFSLAAGLCRRFGVRRGSVVVLILPNSVVFPVAFLAVLAAGGVATTMNPSSAPTEIAAQVRATGASLVLASREGVAKLPHLAAPVVLVPESLGLFRRRRSPRVRLLPCAARQRNDRHRDGGP
ncbi:hypothetical protein GUJ93_ZPchr0010g10845 [Zizania palustris]|uniref:4-coumarate--CoA ligase n=1 Tax=Zizania palustris TaxID=103762 RepID=A0A8J5WCS7_ZIZPA|nr:hypothetical protein GUJ93_ZPchr0010g10845 [Zizania palustris]